MAKGVGVSGELMEAVKRLFQAANAPVVFEELDMSGDDKENQEQMENLIYSVERNGVCIKGRLLEAHNKSIVHTLVKIKFLSQKNAVYSLYFEIWITKSNRAVITILGKR